MMTIPSQATSAAGIATGLIGMNIASAHEMLQHGAQQLGRGSQPGGQFPRFECASGADLSEEFFEHAYNPLNEAKWYIATPIVSETTSSRKMFRSAHRQELVSCFRTATVAAQGMKSMVTTRNERAVAVE